MSKKIILESKKDKIMSELIGKYPNASNTIKRIFDFDTPEGKYSSWIAKNLVNDFEFYGGSYLSPTQFDLILSWYRDLPYFERNYVRLTPKILEKIHDKYPLSDIERAIKAPKDINSYSSNDLFRIRNFLEMNKSKSEQEKEIKKDANKIFEDDKILVVQPMTIKSSCYYGAETKWCTVSTDSGQFDAYFKSGKLYYFIKKGVPDGKYALFVSNGGRDIEVFDSKDRKIELKELNKQFPDLSELIDDLTNNSEDYSNLVLYWETADDLFLYRNTDNMTAQKYPVVVVKLDLDDIIEVFGVEEDYEKSFIQSMFGSYYGIEQTDGSYDYRDGYVFRYFNDDNYEKLKKIASYISPEISSDPNEHVGTNLISDFADKLENLFEDKIDRIVSEYTVLSDRAYEEGAIEQLNQSVISEMKKIGFEYIKDDNRRSDVWAFRIYAPMLIIKFKQSKSEKKSLIRMLNTFLDGELDFSSDNIYEYQGKFDEEEFNNYIESYLYDILESLEETSNPDSVEFVNFLNKNNYKLKRTYDLPRSDKYSFRIIHLDNTKGTVLFDMIRKSDGEKKRMEPTFQGFIDFIYNPTLFSDFGQ